MLAMLTLIFACQLAGEFAAGALGLPVPGPVIGLCLLLALLFLRGGVPAPLAEVSGALQRGMSLLFVPAGTGVILHAGLLAEALVPLALALLVSTAATILVTALVMRALSREAPRG